MIQRFYFQEIKSRVDEPRKFIQVIYGPRQVGKTTLIKQVLSNITQPYIFETADDILGVDAMWLRKIWSDARLQYSQHKQELLLVIDEVQKIENWSEVIKKEWDLDTFNDVPIKLVILGSSSLLIQKGLSESLAGRFESIYIPHWSYKEMKDAFGWSIDEYIWFGGYPGAASLINDEERWKRYVKNSLIEASISKDILMLTRIDKPVLLHRLFEIGCSYSSQILSLTKIQGELMERGNITTLSNYLKMLDTAGLLCGIDKYACDIIRKRASKPKFQVYNNALLSAQSELNFREKNPSMSFPPTPLQSFGRIGLPITTGKSTCSMSTFLPSVCISYITASAPSSFIPSRTESKSCISILFPNSLFSAWGKVVTPVTPSISVITKNFICISSDMGIINIGHIYYKPLLTFRQ